MELLNHGHSKDGRFTLNLVGLTLYCTQDGRLSIIHEIYPGSIQDEAYFNWILKAFKAHKINLLIATDVAARGLDINNFSHVFNYDISKFPENYIHRIGRTSCMNKRGGLIDKEIKERTIYSQENTQCHNPFY